MPSPEGERHFLLRRTPYSSRYIPRAPISASRFRCHALLPSRESCRLRAVQWARSDGSSGLSGETEKNTTFWCEKQSIRMHPPPTLPLLCFPVIQWQDGVHLCWAETRVRQFRLARPKTVNRYLAWKPAFLRILYGDFHFRLCFAEDICGSFSP